MNTPGLTVGQRIELNDGRQATIRFVGTTSFQVGEWVGVELEEPTGKNDGSVKGERYFECEQGFGMFLKPGGVRQVIYDVKPRSAATPAVNGTAAAGKARPSSLHTGVNGMKRQSADVSARRGSAATGTAGSPAPGVARSPAKSPTKQLISNGATSTSTSRTNTPPTRRPLSGTAPGTKPRPSIAPPSTGAAARRTSNLPGSSSTAPRPTRSSLAPGAAASRAPATKGVPSRPSIGRGDVSAARRAPGTRLGATTEDTADGNDSDRPALPSPRDSESSGQSHERDKQEPEQEMVKPNFAPPPIPPGPSAQTSRPRRPSSTTGASVQSQRTIRSTTATNRQIEELEAKVRLLERKRQEDRDIQKSLELAQQERDQLKGIIEKLQNKYRPQQQEIADLKQALEDSEKRFAEVEALQTEHDSVMELATLDREMAEERAEALQAELEALRVKNEEAELELEILKEENGELSKEMSPEERTSAGWLQMEKSNERLREALLRLRDITQDKEAELNQKISALEEQVKDLDNLQARYEQEHENRLKSEADTNDLRQQLEVAMESEEMIEELTERNGRLEAEISRIKTVNQELEDLHELNDELQTEWTRNERQLQDEIDLYESLLMDRDRTAKQQQEALDEADYTITRYRSLVSQMQSDLADMQASKQISETEAAELNSKSRAMLDLNMKLQTSAAKTQVKTIDLELRKLDAQEASEHLAIVQLFLPEAFHSERDSVLALLRFKRIAFKANLVNSFLKERIASFGIRGMEEDVFAGCDAMDKLTWIAGMADRFVNSICSCSVAEFSGYEGALYELEPVERALNSYIDGFRREELKEKDMAEELQRSIAVMTHLAGIHVKNDLACHADDLLMRTQCLQSQLESIAVALGLSRTLIEKNLTALADDEDDEDEHGSISDLALILNRAESLVSQARNAKVIASKTHRSLADLQTRSLTLEGSHTEQFESVEEASAQLAAYARRTGAELQLLFGEEGRNEPYTTDEVAQALSRMATAVFSLSSPEAGPFSAFATRLRGLTDKLSDLAVIPTDLDNTVEFERAPAPWVARANELKATKITSIDTEAELVKSVENLRAKDVVIREKETELEEQSVRIEMLEARMKDAGKRSARIGELERALHEAKDNEAKAKTDLSHAKHDAEIEVERVRAEMARYADSHAKGFGAAAHGSNLEDGAMGAGARLAMRTYERKITALQGATPLSAQKQLAWLHEPLVQPKRAKVQRKEALRGEGRDVLYEMLNLVTKKDAFVSVDLTELPKNKLAWRPIRETARWRVERVRERWVGVGEWGGDVLSDARKPALANGINVSGKAVVV
ncbi:dynactin [Teratosphaeria destructans]|uniref:Dynactin n=1 Tax=Teratosphaeria destructans TaxID=418781 RepID=A0A9W7W2G3_9PEZI|nr:dynactin [Teratosphaeria destructans]